ncbi:hypothetical protein BARRETLEMON_74 [Arthrobacter phage BarretLemon]|uniref:Uncharacterized protein n=1 Tax=Arthrobacter phage BarretLemon TaxID=1796994 RepID=A0A127AVF4_9CAUD|nr:hypothetical protein BJD79_gp74 [Arthrobacter phage BarretLemon]AMM44536.1 hypothetical protein BARRETLEMON_74 [Arthrobacter phage BarretLemon]
MNKRTAERVEKAFKQTQRNRGFAYNFSVVSEGANDIAIRITRNDEDLTAVMIEQGFTIDAIVMTLSDAITEAVEKREAEREAAELARISQPATPAEKRHFESIVGYVNYLMKRYAQTTAEVQEKLAKGQTLSVGTLDSLMQETGRYEAAARVWSIVKRNETIKKSLRDVAELVDRETGFFNPNNSSSNASNVLNAFSTAAYIEFGQMVRGRERY